MTPDAPRSVALWQEALAGHAYIAERSLATAIHLAVALHKPLFVEGEAGVGKTEIAKALAKNQAATSANTAIRMILSGSGLTGAKGFSARSMIVMLSPRFVDWTASVTRAEVFDSRNAR